HVCLRTMDATPVPTANCGLESAIMAGTQPHQRPQQAPLSNWLRCCEISQAVAGAAAAAIVADHNASADQLGDVAQCCVLGTPGQVGVLGCRDETFPVGLEHPVDNFALAFIDRARVDNLP